jgi:quinol monooxygenase YgiN
MGGMSGVRLIVQFMADTKETADKAIEEAAARCKRVQNEPGCLQFEVFRSALQPERYALLEHWASKDDLAVHAQTMVANPPPRNPAISRVREDYEFQETPPPR